MIIRKMVEDDLYHGFLSVLEELAETKLTPVEALQTLKERNKTGIITFVCTAPEDKYDEVVGTASLFIEPKFIHKGGKVGHIEDIVIAKPYRGKSLARKLIDVLIVEAKKAGCYKCILNCNQDLESFYNNNGFFLSGYQMRSNL